MENKDKNQSKSLFVVVRTQKLYIFLMNSMYNFLQALYCFSTKKKYYYCQRILKKRKGTKRNFYKKWGTWIFMAILKHTRRLIFHVFFFSKFTDKFTILISFGFTKKMNIYPVQRLEFLFWNEDSFWININFRSLSTSYDYEICKYTGIIFYRIFNNQSTLISLHLRFINLPLSVD